MSKLRMIRWPLLVAGLVSGCGGPPKTSPRAATKPLAEAPKGLGPLTASEAGDLCLTDPGAGTPADKPLRAAQAKARKLAAKSEGWVGVGRQWVRKARLDSDAGFYVNVEACAAAALRIEPAFVPALELRTLALMNDHRFAEASRLAEEILARESDNVVALGSRADALLELGLYDEAAQAVQRQMTARPGMAAHTRGSYLTWLRGDTRSAKLLVRDALMGRDARDPEPTAWTFVEAATIYWHEADYAGADAVYAEALKWVPDYPAALVGRARVALARHQPSEAVSYLEKAARARPLPETFWLLGDAHTVLGDASRAQQAYDEVVKQGRRGDKLTLALFYATKDRDIEEALRLLENERRTRRGIYVEDAYAWALYRAGRLGEARAASDRALHLGTKDARLLYHAGAIRMAEGGEAEGRTLVQRALAQNPGFDATGATEARALLERPTTRMASNRRGP